MNVSRKDFILGTAAVSVTGLSVSGCKNPPAVDSIHQIFYAGGAATALVLNETKLEQDKRAVIRDIVLKIQRITPEVGQPLSAKWTVIAQEHVDILVTEGKIDSAAAVLIMAGFRTAMAGVDLLEHRHPIVRWSIDYAAAAVDGFCGGFTEYFKVECEDCCDNCTVQATRNGFDITVVSAVRQAAIRNNLK